MKAYVAFVEARLEVELLNKEAINVRLTLITTFNTSETSV
jgi:hypothetical protein